MKSVCIVVPVYRKIPTPFEIVSLKQLAKVLGEFDIFFIAPNGLDIKPYNKIISNAKTVFFEKNYFNSVKSYSSLCKKADFYKYFLGYDYMLIYQTDCFVFKNELISWCNKGYDYIGAPWISQEWMVGMAKDLKMPFIYKYFNKVGNGGFSLRKIKKFYYFAFINSLIANYTNFNEDVFWSNLPRILFPRFNYPSFNEALLFAIEENPKECMKINSNNLPFGCHAWEKYDLNFWREVFVDYGFEV